VCTNLGAASARSRSSSQGGGASELKDFIPPAFTHISNCGTIVVDKTDANGDGLTGAVFGLYTDAAATTLAPANKADNNQCTTAGGNATTFASCQFTNVVPGTYYVKEISAPAHYQADTHIRTVVVARAAGANAAFVDPRNPGTLEVDKKDDKGAGVN